MPFRRHLKARSMKSNRMAMTVGVVAGAAALVGAVAYFATRKSTPTTGGGGGSSGQNWSPYTPSTPLVPGEYRLSAPANWAGTGLNTANAVIAEYYAPGETTPLPADWQNMPGASADAAAAGLNGADDGRQRMDITVTGQNLQLQDTSGLLVWRAL